MSIFHMVEDVLLSLFQSAGDRPEPEKAAVASFFGDRHSPSPLHSKGALREESSLG